MIRMVNQTKLQSFRAQPTYQYGVKIPRNHTEAMMFDKSNNNRNWFTAEQLELKQIDDYEVLEDLGVDGPVPEGFKKIHVHFVYAVKHDGRHKARLVAGGHLTDIPEYSVTSSVASLRGLRMVIFIAELNDLKLWTTDVGNAYLEAYTEEKLFIIGGPEFQSRNGHTMIIRKALYGLRSSGLMWWDRCSEILSKMGFSSSKAENDIWVKRVEDHYDYIVRYVDDLGIASKEPEYLIKELESTHKLKLKGTGPIEYHLGCDFFRDKFGVLCMTPRTYIHKAIENYFRLFGEYPRNNVWSPLERGDHPELDLSEELDLDGIKTYQSLLGALQWAITIGRLDIATAVMTLSKFRIAPRKGHLDRVKRIFSYISRFKEGTVRYRTELPDLSSVKHVEYDWEKTVYGNVTEQIEDGNMEPLGKPVQLTSYVDANLMHDITTGRSVTGILHFLNKTPIDWYTRKQPSVATATFGLEFMAARTATEQILELRSMLRYLGVPVLGSTYLFGDNQSVIQSCALPYGKIRKRHAFHRVRESIAAKIIRFIHVYGKSNPADILSKAWGYQQVWHLLRPLLFWEGDTNDLLKVDDKKNG